MPLSATDADRAERALKRSILRRDNTVAQFNKLSQLSENIEHDRDQKTLFRLRLRDLDSLLANFHADQDDILDQLIMLSREEEYAKSHAPIESTVLDQFYRVQVVATNFDLEVDQTVQSNTSRNLNTNIQLPKIQLPQFNGELREWRSFRDTFTSLVHENGQLSDIEKFHYLISCLSGHALPIVRSVPLTGANYLVAWEALNNRFDNKRLLVNCHLDAMFSFGPLNNESLSGLKRFLDTFQQNIAAINALGVEDLAGFLLFYIASRCLDAQSKRLFESEQHANETPTIDILLTFVQNRCQILQNATSMLSLKQPESSKRSHNKASLFTSNTFDQVHQKSCTMCKENHFLFQCIKFTSLPVQQRFKLAQSRRLCMNCLSDQHKTSACNSKYTCRQCAQKHHSLVHLDKPSSKHKSNELPPVKSTSQNIDNIPSGSSTNDDVSFAGTTYTSSTVVLGTAVVHIRNSSGFWSPMRVLIDSGSQISVITNACVTRLGLPRRHCKTTVVGLAHTPVCDTKGMTYCTIKPEHSNSPLISCEPVIMSKITGSTPSVRLNSSIRRIYSDIQFADPNFDVPGPVDFLLGADIHSFILKDGGKVIHTNGLPSVYETIIGWILSGKSMSNDKSPLTSLMLTADPSIDQLLQSFWSMEEPSPPTAPFTDDDICEELFSRTTQRDENGRYVLSFPFRSDPSLLGDSYHMALSRFYNLERKLQRDTKLYNEYRAFMSEYEKLGHMKRVSVKGKYFIPHHAVVKYVADQLKLRVVFDASANSTSQTSLNKLLYIGPKLQRDITELLLHSRLYPYMVTADICKMYRQILISPGDRDYQHILWRDSPSEPLCEYELCTVTYGVSSSPYQAIRVLHQLESDEGNQYPAAKKILSTQTYVDDIITGANSIQQLLLVQSHLNQLLARGGFELKKWASNCPDVLNSIPSEDRTVALSFDPKDESSIKILGLHWEPASDVFSYHTTAATTTYTKRSILSTIAKLYDPVGALAPITFWAKCFMQQLWQIGLQWDDPLPCDIVDTWRMFSDELPLVEKIKIPRYIPISDSSSAQLLGFSDASEKGYAAVIYLRIVHNDNMITVHFLTSKSKVAPLKIGKCDDKISIPRLELCGALLLAQTMQRVRPIFGQIPNLTEHAWTDSTVVLSWLTSSQTTFKIFVSNRLAKIANILPSCHWHYVSSGQNPADCVSRGLVPSQAVSMSLYWNGPSFLRSSEDTWPINNYVKLSPSSLPELKNINVDVSALTTLSTHIYDWISRFSSLVRLQKTISYVRRFIGLRLKRLPMRTGTITNTELDESLTCAIRSTQTIYFKGLVKLMQSKNNPIVPRSIAQLVPFVDIEGVIRVGGRLQNADINVHQQYPVLLPKKCALTNILIRHFHLTYLHAGTQLVSSLIAQKYWILSSRSAIRHIIFKCVVCARHRATAPQPIMAELPSFRVRPCRPFSNVGVDFAGPFQIKESRRKNAKSTKGYLAVFVCTVIKSVHLEIVSDLTTDAFMASFNRFISRRGIPSNIYSDCGTNFQGANRQLHEILTTTASRQTTLLPCKWHFNPPAAPHFGGIWEAAVKSAKYHLKRVIGVQTFTFEEMSTLSTQIEAILNSRPLTVLSSDPNDLRPLTPGEFLIGQPLVALPSRDFTSIPINRLTRWELIRQCTQSFWNRWSSEYLSSLQRRTKWTRQQPNVEVGDIVLINMPNKAPTYWPMGRVKEVHPGNDGIVRVATIQTADGIIKRPVVKLAVLPIPDDPSS